LFWFQKSIIYGFFLLAKYRPTSDENKPFKLFPIATRQTSQRNKISQFKLLKQPET